MVKGTTMVKCESGVTVEEKKSKNISPMDFTKSSLGKDINIAHN